mgnify:CR=1 FL=1
MEHKIKKNVAFVTIYLGKESSNVNIPVVPRQKNSYFITNRKDIQQILLHKGWEPILVDIPPINTSDVVENEIHYTTLCKQYRVFPQKYIQKKYDYIVIFDNKFNVNVSGTFKTIYKPLLKAISLHPHIFIKPGQGIKKEFKKCIKYQQRYKRQESQYKKYIEEQKKLGLSINHNKHYQVGYIIYNMNHSKINKIQNTWMKHINKCGINDQISFNFIAQIYDEYIEEFIYNYRDDRDKFTLV